MNFTGFVHLNTELARVLGVLRFLGAFWACVTASMAGGSFFGLVQTVKSWKSDKIPRFVLGVIEVSFR